MRAVILAAGLAIAAAPAAAHAMADPLEAVNRQVHAFNVLAQRHVLGPAAAAYMAWTPTPVREGIGNALANLGEPVTAASALLAGEPRTAAKAVVRFGINTTLGYGGVRDAAAERGYLRASRGLADALCRWGVPAGPYVVLPLLGPSTVRDAGGMIVTSVTLTHAVGVEAVLAWKAGTGFVEYAAWHPELDRVERGALDSYATLRSIHYQRRSVTCPTDPLPEEEGEEEG